MQILQIAAVRTWDILSWLEGDGIERWDFYNDSSLIEKNS
jgi:hypothetical protein